MTKVKKKGCLSTVFQFTLFAINIVFMAIFIFSSRAWYNMPSEGLYQSFFGLTYIVWLFINVVFFIWWLVFRRWFFAIVQLIVLLICWSSISVYIPIHLKTSKDKLPSQRLKILTYNVDALQSFTKEEARANPIFDYIKSQEADIVCMQEMSLIIEDNILTDIVTYKEIKDIFSMYPYIHYQTNFQSGKRRSGLMIMSKYPIIEVKDVQLGSTFNGAIVAELEIEGKKVHLMDVHLESNRITASDKDLYKEFLKNSNKEVTKKVEDNIRERMGRGYTIRQDQIEKIQKYLATLNYQTLIICGDFNDTPISYTYYQMTHGNDMIDSFSESGCGMGISFREHLFPFRLDYILHSSNVNSYNSYVDHVDYSDHYPVMTYLELN